MAKIFIALFSLVVVIQAHHHQEAAKVETKIPTPGPQWRQDIRQAVDGARERLQINLVTVLNGMAVTTASAGRNVTTALATLTRAVVNNTFDLASVVAYMPQLLALDLPSQFIALLQLIRRNEVRLPSDVNGALDTVLTVSRQAQESGITNRVFGPITRFLPNMLTGVSEFLTSIIDNAFALIGATPTGGRHIDVTL